MPLWVVWVFPYDVGMSLAEQLIHDSEPWVPKHCGYAFTGRRPDRQATMVPRWLSVLVIVGVIMIAVAAAVASA